MEDQLSVEKEVVVSGKDPGTIAQQFKKWLQDGIPSFTEGQLKIFAMLRDLEINEVFLGKIKEIRRLYAIRPARFTEKQKIRSVEHHGFGEWGIKDRLTSKQKIEITHKISIICNKVGLDDHPDVHRVIRYFLFYNWFPLPELNFDTCKMEVIGGRRGEFLTKKERIDIKYYPVAILISPYASRREIVDFVQRYPLLERFQKPFRKKNALIGKAKLKDPDTRERDDFIWRHRAMKRSSSKNEKNIKALVKKNFEKDLDYTYIAKIISLQKKRRKVL